MGAGERVRVWVAAAVLLLCSQAPQAGGATQISEPLPLKKTGYFVWSPSCKIPYVNPYDTSILPFLKRVRPIVCSDRKPLTYVTSLDQGHVLRVDADVEPQYVRQGYRLTCCYSSVTGPFASLERNNYK
ncbi:hypothetical protein R5R35_014707 [Gryllus longicercus]|uniref:Accessory gland protein n=1 Tax=Gryllus longicercus TaxID=2509291 RepID=A0AAN9V5Y6_9ORTH